MVTDEVNIKKINIFFFFLKMTLFAEVVLPLLAVKIMKEMIKYMNIDVSY